MQSLRPVVHSGSGQTDQDGRLVIELPSDLVAEEGKRLTVEAIAYGRDGQVISGRGQIIVHRGEFYIGLLSQRYVGRVDEEMTVESETAKAVVHTSPRSSHTLGSPWQVQ